MGDSRRLAFFLRAPPVVDPSSALRVEKAVVLLRMIREEECTAIFQAGLRDRVALDEARDSVA